VMYDMNGGEVQEKLEAVLSGEVNRWLLDLSPEIGRYLQSLRMQYEAPLIGARDAAARHGRNVWGVKYPRWPGQIIDLLRAMIPRAKWIYIHRDIVDCARSAKGRGEILRTANAESYAQEWVANLTHVLSLPPSDRLLIVGYDELARDPEAFLSRIEEFSGARPMDRDVLRHRVNDSEGYLPPVELTEAELAIVLKVAGPTRKSVYNR
jgi:hypothetical protein